MNHTPFSYNEALNPRRFIICAMELRPFSLGHYVVLEQLHSPFITDDPEAETELYNGAAQFLMCLMVCSQTYEDNVAMLEDEKRLKKSVKLVNKNLKKSMRKDKQWNLFHKIALFKEYIKYFTHIPVFQVESKSNRPPSGIDWKQNLFTIAKNEWGYSDSEILNMPLRRLFFEWCSYAEKNGAIRVQNEMEMELLENIKR